MLGDNEDHTVHESRHRSSIALSRTSSVSTDATAPNLPGPGRTVGMLFDRLGRHVETITNTVWHTARHSNLQGPEAVAQEIRRLLRHDATTLNERRARYFTPIDLDQFTEKEEKELRKQCRRLLKYSRHRIPSNQYQALEEIVSLTIEDPVARAIFAQYDIDQYLAPKFKEPELFRRAFKALGSIKMEEVHGFWCRALLGGLPEYVGKIRLELISDSGFDVFKLSQWNTHLRGADFKQYIRSLHDDQTYSDLRRLRFSLSDGQSSFLAARYLKEYSLRVLYDGEARSDVVQIVEWLCSCYFQNVMVMPFIVEWETLDELFSHAVVLEKTGQGLVEFAARLLLQNGPRDFKLSRLLTKYFSLEKLFPVHGGEPREKVDHNLFAYLSLIFLQSLSGYGLLRDQISYIRQMDDHMHSLLKGTTITSEAALAYLSIYFEVGRPVNVDGLLDRYWRHNGTFNQPEDYNLLYTCKFLVELTYSENGEDRELATYFLGRCSQMHRYCRDLLVQTILKTRHAERNMELVSSWRMSENSDSVVFRSSLFDESPGIHLLRIRIGDKAYFTPDFAGFVLPRKENIGNGTYLNAKFWRELRIKMRHDLYDQQSVSVDLMFITCNTTMVIQIDPGQAFDVTGHYPVLAGYNSSGEPLYVALRRERLFGLDVFTCVKNGASAITVKDGEGPPTLVSTFFVLVLRHDPVFFDAPSDGGEGTGKIKGKSNRMDPTGPVSWLSYWPKRDPALVDTPEFEAFDRVLESTFGRPTTLLMDDIVEKQKTAGRASDATHTFEASPMPIASQNENTETYRRTVKVTDKVQTGSEMQLKSKEVSQAREAELEEKIRLLEEEVASLRKEMAALREENQALRAGATCNALESVRENQSSL